jgi:hypothetical protein
MKRANTSSGVQMIDSPRTLKLSFTSMGQPVGVYKIRRAPVNL